MGVHDLTLYGVMTRNVNLRGQETAFIQGDEIITHAQFVDMVDRLAKGLSTLGVNLGDRIAVIGENCLEYVYLYGAAARLGAVVLPVNWRLQLDEIRYLFSNCIPKVAFVGSGFQESLYPLTEETGRTHQWYSLGSPADGYKAFENLLKNDGDGPPVDLPENAPLAIIPTAAVAGTPRGAVLTHQNILAANLHHITSLGLSAADVNVGALPLFHIAGLGFCMAIMHAGGASIMLPKFDPDEVAQAVQRHHGSILCEFAPMLSNLLDKAAEQNYDLCSLRCVTGLDQPEAIQRYQKTTGGVFHIIYGQAETSGVGTVAPFSNRPGSAGRPGLLTEIGIIDENGQSLEPGAVGEIAVRGPIVFNGYWHLEDETQHTFRDGWHHTGDLGRLDLDGYLFYEGRKPEKDLIKTGGENVYPMEVEKVILEHPSVVEAVVIGVPDPRWQEAIKAVCVLKDDEPAVESDELKDFVAARIARYKRPKHIEFVTDLPKNDSGRIDRIKVKAQYGAPEPNKGE